MVQGLGRLQVAKCTQGHIFNSIDDALAGIRHVGITSSKQPVGGLREIGTTINGAAPVRLLYHLVSEEDPTGPDPVYCRERLLHNE